VVTRYPAQLIRMYCSTRDPQSYIQCTGMGIIPLVSQFLAINFMICNMKMIKLVATIKLDKVLNNFSVTGNHSQSRHSKDGYKTKTNKRIKSNLISLNWVAVSKEYFLGSSNSKHCCFIECCFGNFVLKCFSLL